MPEVAPVSHRNARCFAAGNPVLERICGRLEAGPAARAELQRISRLGQSRWTRVWRGLERSGLLAKDNGSRRWRLRSDRELRAEWTRPMRYGEESAITARTYVRAPDAPQYERIRVWDTSSRHGWSSPVECPFCGHCLPAPNSSVWRMGRPIGAHCRHLIFVGREKEGWLFQAPRLRRFLQAGDSHATTDLLELAALQDLTGQVYSLAWSGAAALVFYRPSRTFGEWIESLISHGMFFGFAPPAPPVRPGPPAVLWSVDAPSPKAKRRPTKASPERGGKHHPATKQKKRP